MSETPSAPIKLPAHDAIRHLAQHPDWTNELLAAGESLESLEIKDGDAVIGSALITRKKLNKLPYHYHRVTFGPVLNAYTDANMQKALEQILAFAKADGAVYADVHPMAFSDGQGAFSEVFGAHGFKTADHYVYKATVLVDLTEEEEVLFKAFQRRGQKAYRQSVTRGITTEIVPINEANFDTFYALYEQTTNRSGYLIEDKDWLRNQVLYWGERDQMALQFARYEEKAVGALLAYRNGASLSTVYQGNDYDKDIMNRRPANAMYWDLMKWAKANGFDWFDFGGITYTEEMTDDKKGGIFNFKLQFGGNIVFLPGNYRKVLKPVPYKMIQAAMPVYSKIALARAKKG